MSLRTVLTAAMSILAVLAMLAAGSLIVLTSYLHRSASELRAGIESVHFVEEAQVDLLIHSRAVDPVVRAEIEQRIRRGITGARRYITSDHEGEVLAGVEQRLNTYLADGRTTEAPWEPRSDAKGGSNQLEQAFVALEELVEVNLTQARETEALAARWDRIGNILGTTVAAVLIAGVSGILLWIRAIAFKPIFDVATAMRRFGAGEKEAKVREVGLVELREIAQRFNEMATSLRRQHERQMAFLAGVAHDLRNPLSALSMSTAIVSPDKPLPPEARIRSTMALVRRQVERLERMVGDFLDTARIEAGQLELKIEPCDACQLARNVVELFQATSSAHTIRYEGQDEPMVLCIDPARIEQILNNLVSNAIKYSPAGGEVIVRVERQTEHVIISVADRGLGISLEEQPRLFEPFRRAGSPASGIPGMGLGLFVCRRIAEAHGGRIELESEPGSGSTFSVRLPLAAVS
jgi:signal transduction histidine kinase